MDRFVEAQDAGGAYDAALAELRRGRKVSHWMWFVFPQIVGLGRSAMAQRYAVSNLGEARAYLADPVLGQRLRECCEVLLELPGADAESVFGGIDAIKLRSCLTLFGRAAEVELDRQLFTDVLEKYFDGAEDPATLERI
ncbi:calpastatin [Knoellia sinensis KCTC 19936]|uniref:Calpastatin n=1 Tax=Knoellia sinensis KCTC 19936 TaxID=1385520 RepID=A0A0A0JBX1_9MICO|nr:calpastatin [Knoellia sinensis KCTC 19936]